MPGKPTLRPSLADRHPNIRLVGIVVAWEMDDVLGVTVDSTHETGTLSLELIISPSYEGRAEHLRSTSMRSCAIGQVYDRFTMLSKHFQPRKFDSWAGGGVLGLPPRLAAAPAHNPAPASPAAAIGAAKPLTLVPAP
jgi:hypothetical protein